MFTVSAISTNPLWLAIRSGEGQYWDFTLSGWNAFNPADSVLALAADTVFPTLLSVGPPEEPFGQSGCQIVIFQKDKTGTFLPVDIVSSYAGVEGAMPVKAVMGGQFSSITVR
jgi:hypothetical protein